MKTSSSPSTIPASWLWWLSSRQDTLAAQPQITRREKAAMAEIWTSVVRRMYFTDYREFV